MNKYNNSGCKTKKKRTQHTLTSHILYIERAIEKCIAVACRQHKGEEATERKKIHAQQQRCGNVAETEKKPYTFKHKLCKHSEIFT